MTTACIARPVLALAALLTSPWAVPAQEVASAVVEDQAWMAGRWVGESGGMRFEEQWSAPSGGQMMGMFRWVEADSVRLYEFLTIVPDTAGPTLLLRHFGPDLTPWEEEPLRFRLVETGLGRVVFEAQEEDGPTRLVYELSDEDSLVVVLEKDRDGETRRTEFRYRRKTADE